MLTLGMTAGDDNSAIWVLKIELDASTLRYATTSITLSSNLYTGERLLLENDYSLQLGKNSIDVTTIEGLASIQTISFSIANWSSTYIDDFFPTTSQPYLSSRRVSLGVVWTGATTESEITWLFEGYVYQYNYRPNAIDITCLEYADFENVLLPYYKVQKDINDSISYFPNAPTEQFGQPLPILYGSFNIVSFDYFLYRLAPAVCTNLETYQFVPAWHKCKTTVSNISADTIGEYTFNGYEVFRYISEMDNFLIMKPSAGSLINAEFGYGVSLWGSKAKGDTIYGAMVLALPNAGSESDTTDIKNLFDSDTATYVELADTEQVTVKLGYDTTSGQIGLLGGTSTDISFLVFWQSDNGGNRQITLQYYNPSLPTPAYSSITSAGTTTATGGTFVTRSLQIGGTTTVKISGDLPWSLEEINNLEFVATNTSGAGATSGAIRIGRAYLTLQNMVLSRILPKIGNPSIRYDKINGIKINVKFGFNT